MYIVHAKYHKKTPKKQKLKTPQNVSVFEYVGNELFYL